MQIPLRRSSDSKDLSLHSSGHTVLEEEEREDDKESGAEILCSEKMHGRQIPPPSRQSTPSPPGLEPMQSKRSNRSRADADPGAVRRQYRPPKIIVDKAWLEETTETKGGAQMSPPRSPRSPGLSPWRTTERQTRIIGGFRQGSSPQLVEAQQIQQPTLQSGTALHIKSAVMLPLEMEESKEATPTSGSPWSALTGGMTRLGPTFRRRGGSLSWSMGLNILGDWNAETAAFYTKCNDWDSTMLMINVTFGPAAYIMSSSLTEAGLVPAFIMMLFMAGSYLFLLFRMIEIPQLEGCDMETCHDMVRAFVHPKLYHATCFVIVFRILFLCGSLFYAVQLFSEKLLLTQNIKDHYRLTVHCSLLAFLAYTSSFWSSPRSIRMNSKVGFYAMGLSFVLITACLVWKAVTHPTVVLRPVFGSRDAWVGALRKANYAFGGSSFLPHVVGDMQRPQNARQVLKKVVVLLFFIYSAIFLIGFIFLGSAGETSHSNMDLLGRVEEAHKDSRFVGVTCYIARICFVIKCLTSYTIILWPLSREVHRIIGMDRSPPLTLALPWATRQNQRAKLALRFCLVLVSTMLFTQGWGYLKDPKVLGPEKSAVLIGAPHALVEYLLFPACVGSALVRARTRYKKEREGDNPSQAQEFFGVRLRQFAFTIFVLSCIVIIGLFALVAGAARFHRPTMSSAENTTDVNVTID